MKFTKALFDSGKNRAKKCFVWLSRNECIYRNLALEDWLFRRKDYQNCDGLLIWRNGPAAVVGRHQNVWAEVDVEYAKTHGIQVVRRQSGGGAVYHDLGNANICILTSKQRHRRDDNLRMIAKVLAQQWNVNAVVSKRHDLLLNGMYKVSGTAAKLAYDKAYHHFTLMLDVNVNHLYSVLKPSVANIDSKATASIKSVVKTVRDVNSLVTYENLIEELIKEFSSRYDEVMEIKDISSITNQEFPEVENVLEQLTSWEWIYGMTPPFSISQTFRREDNEKILLKIHVDKGVISRFSMCKNDDDNIFAIESDIVAILQSSNFTGRRFEPGLCVDIFKCIRELGFL